MFRITLLQGAFYSAFDLDRIQPAKADAVFLLCDLLAENPAEEDAENIMKAMALGDYLRRRFARHLGLNQGLFRKLRHFWAEVHELAGGVSLARALLVTVRGAWVLACSLSVCQKIERIVCLQI